METPRRIVVSTFFALGLLFTNSSAQIVVNTLVGAGTTNFGDGLCTLREALQNANLNNEGTSGDCASGGADPDTIQFSVVGTMDIGLTASITDSVVIEGPGAKELTITGADTRRLFTVSQPNFVVEISGLTLRDGDAGGSQGGAIRAGSSPGSLLINGVAFLSNEAARGGALYMASGVTTTITNSTFADNVSTDTGLNGSGGAIYGADDMHITNTTFSRNRALAGSGGGAMAVSGTGAVTLDNVTVVYNTAPTGFAGIRVFDGASLAYKNSIIAGNLNTEAADQSTADCSGVSIASEDHNVLGLGTGCDVEGNDILTNAVNAVVDTLADNGGPVPTHALAVGSPALDAGDTVNGGTPTGGCEPAIGSTLEFDARGLSRAKGASFGGSGCDIGAFEAQVPPTGIEVQLTAFLEGPYVGGGLMNAGPPVPYAQPFADSTFDGTLLDYDGPEVIGSNDGSFATNVVDWVLVKLLETGTVIAEQAAFLFIDGSVLNGDLEYPKFSGLGKGSYDIVVAHRNHIPIQTASTLVVSSGVGVWNFTTGMSQAYSGGGSPMKDLGSSKFGMFACDANADGVVTAPDFNAWNASTTAGETGYVAADCNLDGNVTAPDFNLWNANTTAGAASQVP